MTNPIFNDEAAQNLALLSDKSDPAVATFLKYASASKALSASSQEHGPLPHVERQYSRCLDAFVQAQPTTLEGVLAKLLFASEQWDGNGKDAEGCDDKCMLSALTPLKTILAENSLDIEHRTEAEFSTELKMGCAINEAYYQSVALDALITEKTPPFFEEYSDQECVEFNASDYAIRRLIGDVRRIREEYFAE